MCIRDRFFCPAKRVWGQTIAVPDNVSMEDMRQWLNYFFQDVQQVENVPKLGEEAAEEQNVNEGIYITQ